MRNVSYKRVISNPSAAADEIARRTRRQSRIYTISFAILGIALIVYIFYVLSITKYDGFMVSRNVNIRHSDNIAIVDYWVEPGDYVQEGDTLYSYVNVDWLNRAANPYSHVEIRTKSIEARARYNRLLSEHVKIKKTLDSLAGVVETLYRDVDYGVVTKEYAQEKEWELFLCKMEEENTARLLGVELQVVNECESVERLAANGVKSISNYSYSQRSKDLNNYGDAYNYRVAYVDMAIINLQARHGVLIMDGEPTLTYMPYNNSEMLDMHVKMLLTSDDFSDVKNGDIFNAYAGSDFLGKVRITYSSTFINDGVNVEEQSKYEYKFNNREILVRAEFLDPKAVFHKYHVDKHPVVLMKYKWDFLSDFMDRLHTEQRAERDIESENLERVIKKTKRKNYE